MLAPTFEQRRIIEATVEMVSSPIAAAGAIKVFAGAGSGKTSTLSNVAAAVRAIYPKASILYLAYNKALKDEAALKFGGAVDTYTIHGLAMQELNLRALSRPIGDINAHHIRSVIGEFLSDSETFLIKHTVKTFVGGGDDAITPEHVLSRYRGAALSAERKVKIAAYAEALFDELQPGNMRSKLPIPHDVYLKYWQLIGSPGLERYDLVLYDEAQDASGCFIAALEDVGNAAYLGDPHQAIYEFRMAVDALEKVRGRAFPMTKSFRFGQSIADLANKILSQKSRGLDFPLRGNETMQTLILPVDRREPHTRIFRTNRGLIRTALILKDKNIRFSIVGKNDDIKAMVEAAWELRNGNLARVRHYYLKSLKTWDNAVEKAEEGGEGKEIYQAVKIVQEFEQRVPEIVEILSKSTPESDALVILTTAHRSKGREWNNCIIAADFDPILEGAAKVKSAWDSELNLMYVAGTRAMRRLEIQCEWMGAVASA